MVISFRNELFKVPTGQLVDSTDGRNSLLEPWGWRS
jgi:hypothetical protein